MKKKNGFLSKIKPNQNLFEEHKREIEKKLRIERDKQIDVIINKLAEENNLIEKKICEKYEKKLEESL